MVLTHLCPPAQQKLVSQENHRPATMLNGQVVCTEHSLNATAPSYSPLVNRELSKCEGGTPQNGPSKRRRKTYGYCIVSTLSLTPLCVSYHTIYDMTPIIWRNGNEILRQILLRQESSIRLSNKIQHNLFFSLPRSGVYSSLIGGMYYSFNNNFIHSFSI